MAANERAFAAFERELEVEMEREFRDRILEVTKQIALEGVSGVVKKTPVDTGYARASWYVDLGSLQRESNEGRGSLAEAQAKIEQARPFQEIAIANGAEYIRALEQGHSQQAPQGMVDVTVAELRSKYRQVR